jgi:hypothetical protein
MAYFILIRTYMTEKHFILKVSGEDCSKYLATAEFVEVDNLFDSFNGGTCVAIGKTLHCLLSDGSPHVGHWESKYGGKWPDLP